MPGRSRFSGYQIALFLLVLLALAACGGGSAPAATDAPVIVRVGYFPNITHSQALIGIARGDFRQALGRSARIDVKIFNAGPSVIEAMFGGALDLAYVGPNPAVNGYVKSRGQALRIVAGASSGGAGLVVRPEGGINRPGDLAGKKIATPQLGNTQDVALRAYLADHGLKPRDKGGSVEIIPTDNPQILDLFRRGQIDGAWVPEPWASRLIVEGGGRLFLDEATLWPGGDFVTGQVIVSTRFLKEHPDLVRAWLGAHVAVTQWEQAHPQEAQTIVNAEITRLTGKALPSPVLEQAWSRLKVTYDPIATSLVKSADAAYQAGFLTEKPQLDGIYDLGPLNQVLAEQKLPPVK
ncbi:MAG TPA: ABC transporter substrate-binding protein [Anaerolineae bacterium]